MPRYALKITYDGAPFKGWQYQPDLPSIQGALENAAEKLETGRQARFGHIQGSGRTDTGVHATAQVAHIDFTRDWDAFRLSEALNFHLRPAPVAIVAAAYVAPDWNARFSCLGRRYIYRLLPRRARQTFGAGTAWQIGRPLDPAAMQAAADFLVGQHDFTTFRSSICQAASPVKTLDQLDIIEANGLEGPEIQIHAAARSFLHNQIRSFAGTLERVGIGAWAPEDVRTALEARDRAACGPVAPPHGLYFIGAEYDPDPFIP